MIERERKPLITEVNKLEPVRFSDEAREWLKKNQYFVYPLTRQSIASLIAKGRNFSSNLHERYPGLKIITSRLSEVAINPMQLFLAKSNNKSLSQQLELVVNFSQDVSQKVPGVEAIIAEAPDYIELAFTHLYATGKYLFGRDYNYDYARTVTAVGPYFVNVGDFYLGHGVDLSRWHPDCVGPDLWGPLSSSRRRGNKFQIIISVDDCGLNIIILHKSSGA